MKYSNVPLVSISESQKRPIPDASWCGTVYHGLPRSLHTFREGKGQYLAFLGRISPDKGIDHAIEIAQQSGMSLKIAAKIYPEDRSYFESRIRPMLAQSQHVEFVGEVGGREKDEFLGNAKALLFPVEWAEPFGLVMIEALACGTPVIAWRRGAVPEIIEDGVSGFAVNDINAAVAKVAEIDHIDRRLCRKAFEARFGVEEMAKGYIKLYEQQIATVERLHNAN
jgi:glycosyltransferase involved in cell wall biosynthesis